MVVYVKWLLYYDVIRLKQRQHATLQVYDYDLFLDVALYPVRWTLVQLNCAC